MISVGRINAQIIEALTHKRRGAERTPTRAAIRRAQDTRAEPRPPVSFPGATVDDRRIARVKDKSANGGGRCIVSTRGPGGPAVEALPNTSIRSTTEDMGRVARI